MSTESEPSTRVQDGEMQHRIRTTKGMAFLFRTLVSQPGWHAGAKEFSRARRLAKAVAEKGALVPPDDRDAAEAWGQESFEFWLSERLRDHGKKCLTHALDKGILGGGADDDAIEPFLLAMGISLKDD